MTTRRRPSNTKRVRARRAVRPRSPVETTFDAGVFDEPNLLFGGRHTHIDPKTGLWLYGPYSLGREDQIPLQSITVGIIGTPDLVFKMKNWLQECQEQITNDGREPFWRPAFPGINQNSCFQCRLVFGDTWQETLTSEQLSALLQIPTYSAQLEKVVEWYQGALARMLEREPKPNVIVCITPEEIDESLRDLYDNVEETPDPSPPVDSRDSEGTIPHENDDEDENPMNSLPFNVRRALKASFMKFDVPTQLVRGSTLGQVRGIAQRQRQDPATSAWNLIAGLYYKAGSHLWRVADVHQGTCYVGISFYRERLDSKPAMRTSLAQIFTHKGDGLILRGKTFEWQRSQGNSPHLTEELAEELLRDAIDKYTAHSTGNAPTRLVLHKSSRFEEPEKRGFMKALGNSIREWDFVAMQKRGIQFFRQGYHAPLRGMWVRLGEKDYLLYTRGYIPFFGLYPGMRVPQPLEIVEHHGNSTPDFVLNEVLALTKMNWNSADFSCEEPITLNFSRKVGEILALIPKGAPLKEEYRYYM